MVLLIILACVLGLCIQFFVAKQFEEVAFSKGYGKEEHAFLMVFFLGIVGMLYVIALPDLRNRMITRGNSMDSTSLLKHENHKVVQENSIKVSTVFRTSNGQYQCKNCGNIVKINQEKCSDCGALLSWDNK